MTVWTPPGNPNELQRRLNDYVLAVAGELMAAGISVSSAEVYLAPAENDQPEAWLALYFPYDYGRRFCNLDEMLTLDWSSRSGWSVRLGRTEQALTRWMGAGLVPDAKQVANFVTGALVDIHTAGAPDQPVYPRTASGEGQLEAVLDRLRGCTIERPSSVSVGESLGLMRQRALYQHAVRDLAASGGGEVRLVPLHEAEVRALGRVLDLLDSGYVHELRDLLGAVADDLQQRWSGAGAVPINDREQLAARYRQAIGLAQAAPR